MTAPHEMTPFLNVAVYGKVIEQGSKKAFRRGKGTQIVDNNKDVLHPWREQVTTAVRNAQVFTSTPVAGPVLAVVTFVIKPPASIPADRLGYPCVRPDLDKYERAIGDALTDAKVFTDDGQITDWVARKRYVGQPSARLTRPGVWIRLYQMLDDRQDDR